DTTQFHFENAPQLFGCQCAKYNYLVDAIHEFWQELPSCRFHCGAVDFLIDRIEVLIPICRPVGKSNASNQHSTYFDRAEIRCQHDDTAGQINFASIAQG